MLRLVHLIRGYWGAIARGIALGLAVGILGMVTPYVSKLLIDEAYPTGHVTLMHVLVAGTLAMGITSVVIGGLRNYNSQVVGAQLNGSATLMFFNHIQHLPTRFFDEHRVGEIMSRFQDLGASLGAVNRLFETVLLRGAYLLLVPPVLFLLNWKLALLSMVTLPLTTCVSASAGKVLRTYWKGSAEAYADLNAFQVETLTNVRTHKAMATEHVIYTYADARLKKALRLGLTAAGLSTAVAMVNSTLRAAGMALFTWFGWTLILRGELTLGAYVAFTAYQGYLVGPLNQFASAFVSLQQTAVALGRTFEYLDEPTEQDPSLAFSAPAAIQHPLRGALQLTGVSFSYTPGARVLHDLNIDIPAGELVALVGPSGAGKSSIFRLLCRMEEPDGGSIRADGVPLSTIPLPDLRRQMAVVWQDVALARGSLWDNLTLGVEAPSQGAVEDVVRACCLDDVIAALPRGFNTSVAEWGPNLSGGQRQRVAIARALLRDAPILLLDEAMSNLDVETEAAIVHALFARLPRRTLIFSTHRLATAQLAERIVVLDRGRLVGLGTHAELMSACRLYRDLHGQRRSAAYA